MKRFLLSVLLVFVLVTPAWAVSWDIGGVDSVYMGTGGGMTLVTDDSSPVQLCGGGSDNQWILLSTHSGRDILAKIIQDAVVHNKKIRIGTDTTIPYCSGTYHIVKYVHYLDSDQ